MRAYLSLIDNKYRSIIELMDMYVENIRHIPNIILDKSNPVYWHTAAQFGYATLKFDSDEELKSFLNDFADIMPREIKVGCSKEAIVEALISDYEDFMARVNTIAKGVELMMIPVYASVTTKPTSAQPVKIEIPEIPQCWNN